MKNSLIIFLLACFLSVGNTISAQEMIGYHSDADYSTHAFLQSDYSLNASSLSNSFLLKVLNEPFLSNDLLSKYDDKQKAFNRAGYISNTNLFMQYKAFNQLAFSLNIEQNYIEQIRYTNDMFHLLFIGNKKFVGDKANLDGVRYSRFNYTTFRAGLNFHSRDNRHHISLLPAFHIGNQYQSFRLNEVEFYTAADASMLELSGRYTNMRSRNDQKGFGASFGLMYSYTSGDHYLKTSLLDVGRIYWQGMRYTDLNQTYTFSGFDVQNIFQADDQFASLNLNDTISSVLNEHKEDRTVSVWLPFKFNFEYIYSLPDDRWDVGLRLHHQFLSSYIPHVRVDGYYHINDQWHCSGIVSYGGYGGLTVGASGLYQFHPKMKIALETQYLSSLVLSSVTTGLGGFINFSYQL
jgi:hypothetical protein